MSNEPSTTRLGNQKVPGKELADAWNERKNFEKTATNAGSSRLNARRRTIPLGIYTPEKLKSRLELMLELFEKKPVWTYEDLAEEHIGRKTLSNFKRIYGKFKCARFAGSRGGRHIYKIWNLYEDDLRINRSYFYLEGDPEALDYFARLIKKPADHHHQHALTSALANSGFSEGEIQKIYCALYDGEYISWRRAKETNGGKPVKYGVSNKKFLQMLEELRGKQVAVSDIPYAGSTRCLGSLCRVGAVKRLSKGVYIIPEDFSAKNAAQATRQFMSNAFKEHFDKLRAKFGEAVFEGHGIIDDGKSYYVGRRGDYARIFYDEVSRPSQNWYDFKKSMYKTVKRYLNSRE